MIRSKTQVKRKTRERASTELVTKVEYIWLPKPSTFRDTFIVSGVTIVVNKPKLLRTELQVSL